MSDLNSTMFYKVKFTIESLDESADLLWMLILHIYKWQTKKWNKNQIFIDDSLPVWTGLKYGSHISAKNGSNSIYIVSDYFSPNEDKEYWACKIVEQYSHQGICPRQWTTEIGFEREKPQQAVFSCVLSYSDIPGFIGPYESTPSRITMPTLILFLLKDKNIQCSIGGDVLNTIRATKLATGSFPDFWKALISDSRKMPYIYISPMQKQLTTREVILPLIPDALAEAVCGNALVFYSDSLDFSDEMKCCCDENYLCYAGRVKVYMPGINTDNPEDQYRHRYLTPDYISEAGEDATIKIFRRALAQNVYFYESFFRIENCRKLRDEDTRQKRLFELRRKHNEEIANISEDMLDEAIQAEEKMLEAEAHVESLETDLAEAKEKIHGYESQIANMGPVFNEAKEQLSALNSRLQIGKWPDSPKLIIEFFSALFGDKIVFTKDATDSLKNCTIKRSDLWGVLFQLSTFMQRLFSDGSSDPYGEFKNSTGFDCARGEGSMTHKDKGLMKQFITEYDGREIDIEPHITFPQDEQSIHFGYDTISQKIVVGHCGEHKEIYSSRKHK